MNIYLTNTFDQLKQFVASFPNGSLPVILAKDAAFLISGWSFTARIVDQISKKHPFVKNLKAPISAFGAVSILFLSRMSPISAVGILAAIAFASSKVKTTYSPEEFKILLLQKHPFPPNIVVTGNLDLFDSTEFTSLPEGLTVRGSLYISQCTGLTSLPKGLIVQGNLSLYDCTGLTSLPKGLTVKGNLNLYDCTGLTSLPEGLAVKGNLTLSGCTWLTSLPKGLIVQGSLILSDCTGLTSLPEGLAVKGNLTLAGCTGLTSLPKGLTVQGNLTIAVCTGLTSLPEGLTVQGDLELHKCTWLTSLPKGLIVQGSLILSDCTGLTSLPEELAVKGCLNLSWCTGLTSLPEELTVGGELVLSCCTGLTLLPEGLTFGGNLSLVNCTGLTSLPNWITTLGPLANGTTRRIYLMGTGLSEAFLTRLRETPAPGIQFHFSNAAVVAQQIFPDLDTALTFWVKATNDETLTNPPITIDSDEALSDVLRFLSQLIETAEYKNPQARPVLAMRVIEAFSLMAENESIKGRAFEIIHEGLTSCVDRIISALEEIELMVLLHQIETQIETRSHTETELRALGKRFLLLEMVNAKAEAHISTLTWVDEIEIYLAFRIGLAVRLDLPVKTRNMIFRGCAQVTDEQINQSGDAVLRECTEEKLNGFLKRWNPWIKHQRKTAPVPAYKDLPVTDRKLASSDMCPITQGIPEKPVLCGHTVYDYDALIGWYRENGTNPAERSPIDLEKLKRIDTLEASSKT